MATRLPREKSLSFEKPYGRGSVASDDLLPLVGRLREMEMARNGQPVGDFERQRDRLGRSSMERVRSGLNRHERIVLVRLGELDGSLGRLLRGLSEAGGRVRRRVSVVEGAREHEPDAEIARGTDYVLGILVATVVQIEEVDCGRHPRKKCLGECEQRSRVDRVAVELL